MANEITFASIGSTDAPNVYISRQMYRLSERNLRLGKYATRFDLPQRMGKTLRVVRYQRMASPTGPLTEGVPPENTALTVQNVDVTVEQWGIVALITDVAQITTTHPALQIAIDRTSLAMAEALEREIATMLLAGTRVIFPGVVTSRAGLATTDKVTSTTIFKATNTLRQLGAATFDGDLFAGVMDTAVEAELLSADTVFQSAHNFVNVKALEYAEIGMWAGVRWTRSNFLPHLKSVAAPTTGAATAEKAQLTAVDGGGTIGSAANFKFAIVAKDVYSGFERKVSLTSANLASAATGDNESFSVVVPTSTNYTYDVYMSASGGTGSLFKVKTGILGGATTVIAAPAAGTEATLPATSSTDQVEVLYSWIFGKDAYGRVELNGMSLQSYITPAAASYSNPLAQGRKVGSKLMWKSFILDNDFFVRIESSTAAFGGLLPA